MVRIVSTVISDLVTDQRVHKTCTALQEAGYTVSLIGTCRKDSLPLSARSYKASRLPLVFQQKALFYAEVNLRLFWRLLFTRADVFLGNDLDVMPATYLAARLKRKPVVYDTHEYFLGMGGLEQKPFIRKVWSRIEAFLFPRLPHIYTVCDSVADLYQQDYGKRPGVVRNVPYLQPRMAVQHNHAALIAGIEQQIPPGRHLLLFQGAGIHIHRGVEELVEAMCYLDTSRFHLLIVGGGDIFTTIQQKVAGLQLEACITLVPKVPFEVLRHITAKAAIGLSTDKPDSINHRYGLPNKLFDYIHAGVPVLATRLVEIEKIITRYEVGTFLENNDPRQTAAAIEHIFSTPDQLQRWKNNTARAKQELNWEKESQAIIRLFHTICTDPNEN